MHTLEFPGIIVDNIGFRQILLRIRHIIAEFNPEQRAGFENFQPTLPNRKATVADIVVDIRIRSADDDFRYFRLVIFTVFDFVFILLSF